MLSCRAIDRQSPHFLKALTATASIQRDHKRDPAAYVQCYSQLAEQHGDYESYRLLGAALLRIQEPEKAIKACSYSHLIILLNANLVAQPVTEYAAHDTAVCMHDHIPLPS